MLHRREVQVLHPGSLKARAEKEPVEDAWKRHLTVYPSGCPSFKAGDLRPPVPTADQGALF